MGKEFRLMSTSMLRLGIAITALTLLPACRWNPKHCEGNPNDDCDLEWDAATSAQCTSNEQCETTKPVCDVAGSQTCVQCTAAQPAACSGSMPVCGTDQNCRGCQAHAECSSSACLPDGACAAESSVAYVAASGSGTTCSKAAPCGTLAAGLATNRSVVKISGLIKDTQTTTIDAKAVTIIADPGAILDRDGDGVILEVRNTNADVKIYDLQISGASGGVGDVGISLPSGGTPKLMLTRVKVSANIGGGISSSSGLVTLAQSTVSGNAASGISALGGQLSIVRSTISGNGGGGIKIDGAAFDITNSFIVQNGGPTSLVGGINLGTVSGTGARRVDFNTIAANGGTATVNSGINCGTVGAPLVFSNNIIYGNAVSGGGKQVGGSANCATSYSDVGPDATTGTGNINQDPAFINSAQGDFHLMNNSPAKNAADGAATLANDVDGDARPQGAARDIGADEIKE